jgi:hypothetical protein
LKKLLKIAERVAKIPRAEGINQLRNELKGIELPSSFSLPLSTEFELTSINIAHCRVMDSKKKPLWMFKLMCFILIFKVIFLLNQRKKELKANQGKLKKILKIHLT